MRPISTAAGLLGLGVVGCASLNRRPLPEGRPR
jgi:hypothetical protein